MIYVSGDNFTRLYYHLLCLANESSNDIVNSRNGPVKDLGPAAIEINGDIFRLPILLNRKFNPFFALMEFSWLIYGSNQVEPLNFFIKDYKRYSDDGLTLNGSYGYRLRHNFNIDQIAKVIELLKRDPFSRRAVLTMWSVDDLGSHSKDIPCNTSIMLKLRNGYLDISVTNRSNDLYLGVPYNIALFYLLQNYLAIHIGCKVGRQLHFTDSLHLYQENFDKVALIKKSNSDEIINRNIKKLPVYDLSSFITVEHEKMLEKKFEQINCKVISDFYIAYSLYRNGSAQGEIVRLLPKNSLGYSAYIWLPDNADKTVDNFL